MHKSLLRQVVHLTILYWLHASWVVDICVRNYVSSACRIDLTYDILYINWSLVVQGYNY